MRALLVAILFALPLVTVDASSENPRTKQELEQFYGAEYPRVSEAQKEKVTRAAIRAQETGTCNLHHVKMQKKRVPVHYGLLVFDDPYYTAQVCYFAHAREYVNGGCDISSLDFQKEQAWRIYVQSASVLKGSGRLRIRKVNGRKIFSLDGEGLTSR